MDAANLHIGTAGWSYADWKGIVYPDVQPRGFHALDVLARWFNLVEINSSFYHPPSARNAEAWARRVAPYPEFQFTAKIWQRFTHERGSWPSEPEIRQYTEGIAPLREAGRLGAVLAQFPWSFRRTAANRQWLARVCDCFAGYPLVVELRHASWDVPELYAGFAAREIAFCNIDQPLFEDSIAPTAHVTAPLAYVRLHGRNYEHWFREESGPNDRYNYLYNEEELNPWLERIQAMRGRARSVYAVTNNHFRGQAVANALEIAAGLGAAKYGGLPPGLLAAYPRLRALARAES